MGVGSASWGVWGSAPPPYVVQFCLFSPCNGLPAPPPPRHWAPLAIYYSMLPTPPE